MTAKKQDLINVIASRANAVDYWAFMHYLPNPDPVLKKMGKDISAYREILSDSHVGGCVRRRKAAIKGLEWRITPTGNEKIDRILTTLFDRLPISQIISEMLDATLFGYQALEVQWKQEGKHWLPESIVGKPQEWFVFDEENQLKHRTKTTPEGEFIPPYRMLLASQNATYINPYGLGDLSLCFWAATFKKGGFKFWLEFVEKYGSPWLVGKHPRQNQPHETDDLLDSLEKMLGTAVAAIPNDSSIEMLESASKGASSQVFDDFLKYCKSEIAIALLGQNQTTEAEANRASSQAGLEVTRDIRDDDVKLVQAAFNQLLKWICELNFSVETLPTFELFEQESIDKVQAERDQMLASLGVQFTEQYLTRTYGFEKGDIVVAEISANSQISPSPSLQKRGIDKSPRKSSNERNPGFSLQKSGIDKGAEQVEFAEPIPKSVIESIGEQLEVEGEAHVEQWLQSIRDQLGQAESLEDFRNQLDSLIPELSFAEYGELLAWGSTAAQFAGRQSVEDERVKSPSRQK